MQFGGAILSVCKWKIRTVEDQCLDSAYKGEKQSKSGQAPWRLHDIITYQIKEQDSYELGGTMTSSFIIRYGTWKHHLSLFNLKKTKNLSSTSRDLEFSSSSNEKSAHRHEAWKFCRDVQCENVRFSLFHPKRRKLRRNSFSRSENTAYKDFTQIQKTNHTDDFTQIQKILGTLDNVTEYQY